MRTSATGTWIERRPIPRGTAESGGFTLLEVLVVLFIIGITLGLATLSLDARDGLRVAEEEARRLAALIELAGQEAVLNSEELGVRFTENGYRFYRLAQEGWRPVEDEPVFRARRLPEGVRLELDLEREAGGPGDRGAPQVLLLSSGEMTAFELIIRPPGNTPYYRLNASPTGKLELTGPVSG